jgi:pteridine reductase
MVPESVAGSEGYYIREKTLLKKLGKPEHVAHAVLFLVENDFVTGVCLPVDGGRTIAG